MVVNSIASAARVNLVSRAPGSVMRLTLTKPKEGKTTEEVGGDWRRWNRSVFGENFSPARTKGYTMGFGSVLRAWRTLGLL